MKRLGPPGAPASWWSAGSPPSGSSAWSLQTPCRWSPLRPSPGFRLCRSGSSSSSAAPAALGGAELRTPPAAGVGPAPCRPALRPAPTRPRPRTCRLALQRSPEFSVEPKSWSFGPSFYNRVLFLISSLPSVNQSRRPKSSWHLIPCLLL